jgi:hypothetical protein
LKAAGLSFLAASLFFAGNAFGQAHVVTRVKQPLDLGAEINARIASLPTIGGYKAGRVEIPVGDYFQSTPVIVNSPRVSIVGVGAGAVQITCTMNAPCWEIRLNPFVTDPQVGGQIGGFTLIGQLTNPNAVGIHMGDITNIRLEDILIQGFTGANAVGLWFDNINGWTERNNIQRVNLNGNTTNYKFTNSGTPATASFCYNQWLDLKMNVYTGQKGIDFQGGNLCSSTLMVIMNGQGDNKTYIQISGTSYWNNNLYDIKTENDGGSGVRLRTAVGTVFNGTGKIANVFGALTDSILGTFNLFMPYLGGTTFSDTSESSQWYIDQFANLQAGAQLPATASNNFNSPMIALKSSCWNGSATALDYWQLQNVVSPGANPASTLQFAFTPYGCTSIPQFQVADGVGSGFLLSTTEPGQSPRIRHDADDNLVVDTGSVHASLYLNTDNNRPVKLGMGGTTGANIPIVGTVTTAAAASTNVPVPGVTSSSHCSLTATNASAAMNTSTTFISAKGADQITVTHMPLAGMTYDVLCTPN